LPRNKRNCIKEALRKYFGSLNITSRAKLMFSSSYFISYIQSMPKRIVVALGGNAINQKGERGTFEEQYNNVYKTMEAIVPLVEDEKNEVVITHGNGPQVGAILLQNASAKKETPEMPMFVCGAMSQGEIGFFIQQSIRNILAKKGKKKEIATIITQVEVDTQDSAFSNPTKPVGPFYTEEEAKQITKETGYTIKEDAGRGYRRMVPSPRPKSIVEIEFIRESLEAGNLVVCSGGGGIPVYYENGQLNGVDAVIDKDRAASLMADELEADEVIILTAVDKVAVNFGKPDQTDLDEMNITQAQKYLEEGHFAEGSMKPKVEALIEFVAKKDGRKALITSPAKLAEALEGKNGTWIV
jgi:carbamate kinase